ncbi:MAG: hypothetical protein ACI8W7_004816 [Gammaproteobacteria bacterium]|jgi:hypothetical protein
MNADNECDFELPDDLSAEAAAQLIACLYEIARVIENRYFVQIRQHYADRDEQLRLWDKDPPF